MINRVKLCREISVLVENKIGILADIARILADHGVNIEAVAGYVRESKRNAEIMLVVDDSGRATDALKKQKIRLVKERDVLIVELENKLGALKALTAILALAKVSIKYIYGTVCSAACPARIVLSTSHNEKAFAALKK